MNGGFSPQDWERMRGLLCRLQDDIRDALISARASAAAGGFASVAAVTAADTIYGIDKVSEGTVLGWLAVSWPPEWPVELVMEGIGEDGVPVTFPRHTPLSQTRVKLIVDPIDGTRCLMYDKRPAWALAAVAPQHGPTTGLSHLMAAAMTELPTSKQWRADQLSAVRGAGPGGLVAESVNVLTSERQPLAVRPSQATDFRHGFASLVKFFPEGKALTAQIEEAMWDQLHGRGRPATAASSSMTSIFLPADKSTNCLPGTTASSATCGRSSCPHSGTRTPLTCHPYDICTALLLTEAGGVIESPDGRPLDAPLDTLTPVAWIGYANETLARLARPVLWQTCEHYLASAWRNAR